MFSSIPGIQYSTLYADIPTESITTDDLGNRVPVTQRREFTAFLNSAESPLDPTEYLPGVNLQLTWLEGFLVSPIRFPDNFYPKGGKGREVGYEFGWAKGILFLVAPPLLSYRYEEFTGERVAGWVRYP